MNEHEVAENDTTGSDKTPRRPYEAPTVTDFFQPIVALGTGNSTDCATPRRPAKR
jgi:hypothetical protein